MPEPEEVPFACIGCGMMNPAGAEVCSGCGHRFAGPGGEPPPAKVEPAPIAPEPPPAVPARTSPFRPILLVVVPIAVGAGLLVVSPSVGIALLASAVPAIVWTFLVSGRRKRGGRPIGPDEKLRVFALALGEAFLVIVSSAIAFVATCFPIGLIGMQGEAASDRITVIAFVVGGVAAALVGGFVASLRMKVGRDRHAKGRPGEDQP